MTLEEQVAKLLAAGDAKGATTIVLRAHGLAAHRLLFAILGDPTLADDAHALFAEWVWRGIGSYRGLSSLRAWCFGVAAHAARRVREEPWRRRARRLSTTGAAALVARQAPSSQPAADDLERGLAAVRAELSDSERTLLVLRLDRSLGWREIEQILRELGDPSSAPALRKRYERLRSKLAQMLKDRGLLDTARA